MSCQTEVPSPSPTCIWLQLISHLSNQSNKPQRSLRMPGLRLFWFRALERLIWKDFANISLLIIFLAHMFLWTVLLGKSMPATYISCRFRSAYPELIFIVFFSPIFPFGWLWANWHNKEARSNHEDFSDRQGYRNTKLPHSQEINISLRPFGKESRKAVPNTIYRTSTMNILLYTNKMKLVW